MVKMTALLLVLYEIKTSTAGPSCCACPTDLALPDTNDDNDVEDHGEYGEHHLEHCDHQTVHPEAATV